MFGTPHYMSPEQSRSTAQVDHRSDIYALGCILFELITGEPPFDGEVRQVLGCHKRVQAPRAASSVPSLAPELDELIASMLAKDPMKRPQTMGAVQRALQRISSLTAARQASQPAILLVPIPDELAPLPHAPPRSVQVPPEHDDAARMSGVLLVPPTGARDGFAGDAVARPADPPRHDQLLRYLALGMLVIIAAIALAVATSG